MSHFQLRRDHRATFHTQILPEGASRQRKLRHATCSLSRQSARTAPLRFRRLDTLGGRIADELRHGGFGENRIGSLIRAQTEKKPEAKECGGK
jgi:hypothetical protein